MRIYIGYWTLNIYYYYVAEEAYSTQYPKKKENNEMLGIQLLIQSSLEGNHSVQRKISTKKSQVVIYSMMLYRRLRVAGIGSIEFQTLFQYELCSYPTYIFDQMFMVRIADKD